MTAVFVLIASLAFLMGAYQFVQRTRARRDIAPASDLQRHFGLYAGNRPVIHLDPALVPSDLRHLIPLAEKWGIGDDLIRTDLSRSRVTPRGVTCTMLCTSRLSA